MTNAYILNFTFLILHFALLSDYVQSVYYPLVWYSYLLTVHTLQ